MTTDIITTHFDYHSIDHNLLKLDILGHDDPTMIRMLEEYITSDALPNEYNEEHPFIATEIPLDDRNVISLFHDTSALGIKPEDISGCPLRYPDGAGGKSAVAIGSDPDFRTVSRNQCVAGQCAGADQSRKGNDFHGDLYPR